MKFKLTVFLPPIIFICYLSYLTYELYLNNDESIKKNNIATNKISLNRKINSVELHELENEYKKIKAIAPIVDTATQEEIKRSEKFSAEEAFLERIKTNISKSVRSILNEIYFANQQVESDSEVKKVKFNELSNQLSTLSKEENAELWISLNEEIKNENYEFLNDFHSIYLLHNSPDSLEDLYLRNTQYINLDQETGPKVDFFLNGINLIFKNNKNNEANEMFRTSLNKTKLKPELLKRVITNYKANYSKYSEEEFNKFLSEAGITSSIFDNEQTTKELKEK